ncbi:hypothetical protein ACIBG6_03815 [Streptomyces sp. NPDC050842]|uniref:hypothetical protein n=1 Tax=Streptomyces sp. NPDC050842 TaxID=3365636 RepID=UPI00379C4D51
MTTVSFGEVPWSFAQAEGEGYPDAAHWRCVHADYWQDSEGRVITDDTPRGVHALPAHDPGVGLICVE